MGGRSAIGLGTSVEDSFPLRAGSVGLSPSSSALESLKEVGPSPSKGGVFGPIGLTLFNPRKCYVSALGRLELVRPKMAPKETFRVPSSLPKTVLVRAKGPDFSIACSCAEERYCLPSMLNLSLSSSILDRIPPSEEFFGQGGVVEIES